MKKCTGDNYNWDHCRVEKLGCNGCYYYKEEVQNMKVKNVKLEWNVIVHDFNSNKLKTYNVLSETFIENLAKAIKKCKIQNRDQLKEHLRREFMYHYWSKSEWEIAVGGLSSKFPEDFKKIDVWYQIEMNFDNIIDYIISNMKLFQKRG